jgi:hypothetical protein
VLVARFFGLVSTLFALRERVTGSLGSDGANGSPKRMACISENAERKLLLEENVSFPSERSCSDALSKLCLLNITA